MEEIQYIYGMMPQVQTMEPSKIFQLAKMYAVTMWNVEDLSYQVAYVHFGRGRH